MPTLSQQTSWHTAEAISHAKDIAGDDPVMWRRIGWGDDPIPFWFYYDGGIWFKLLSDGTVEIVEAADMTDEDFLALDWTTQSAACVTDGVPDCPTDGEFYVDGFYREDLSGEVDFTNPNAPYCGDACAIPDVPGTLTGEDGAGGDGGGGGSGSSGGSGSGSGTGSSSGIGGRRKIRKKNPNNVNWSLTIDNVVDDIPVCLTEPAANPAEYTVSAWDVTLSDPDDPSDIWFVRSFFKGEQISNDTMVHGDSIQITPVAPQGTGELRHGFSHHIRVTAWKTGGTMMATKAVTMTFPCSSYFAGDYPQQNDGDIL